MAATTGLSVEELRRLVDEVPYWFHSIDLGQGVVTPGHKSAETLAAELEALELGDLRGRSLLDIGGWDGFFAFEAERRGARRVAVLDHYQWSVDLAEWLDYARKFKGETEGRKRPRSSHELHFWHPDTMPGKRGFDLARRARASTVEEMPVDFMTCDLDAVGAWDVVLYLGVLYHIEDPVMALQRLARVTRELAVVETEAVLIPGHEDQPLWRFFPGTELNGDPTNWWAPNRAGLEGALRAAGFARTEVVVGPASSQLVIQRGIPHFRAIVHAHKQGT